MRPRVMGLVVLLAPAAVLLPALLSAQPASTDGSRFVTGSVGLARVEGKTGISATLGVGFRRGRLLATLSPLDALVIPTWGDEYREVTVAGSGVECRRNAGGELVESSLCDARAEYGASAEAGALLGSGTTRVWVGGGYVVGTTSTAYAGVTTLFRWGDAPHLQLRLRAGDHLVQGAVGLGSAF